MPNKGVRRELCAFRETGGRSSKNGREGRGQHSEAAVPQELKGKEGREGMNRIIIRQMTSIPGKKTTRLNIG